MNEIRNRNSDYIWACNLSNLNFMMRITFFVAVSCLAYCLFAQRHDDILDIIPTENQDIRKDANKRENRSKKKKYDVIYRPTVNSILYGNPCAVEATHKMGFEYMVEPRRINGSKTQKGKFLNNLWVKSKLVVLHSPFWKIVLKKKFKRCRPKSGDIVG